VHAKRELFRRRGLERAEVRRAGRACERVEASDPVVHGPHGVVRADVQLHVAGLASGHDHVVPSRKDLDHGRIVPLRCSFYLPTEASIGRRRSRI
jgi:hypothetical protein